MDYHYQMPTSIGLDDFMKQKSMISLKKLTLQDIKKNIPKYAESIVNHAQKL